MKMSDEQINPYYGICKRHGSWKGPIDECPDCMEENYRVQQVHEWDWVPKLCGSCNFFDDGNCDFYPKMPVEFFGRKKKCKYYKKRVIRNE